MFAVGATRYPTFGYKVDNPRNFFFLSSESNLHFFQNVGLGTVIPGENRTLIVLKTNLKRKLVYKRKTSL